MKTILSLLTIAIALSSCSKLDDITPEYTQPLYENKQEVHVYYDSAVYHIQINGKFKEGGNTQRHGVDVYRIDSLSNLNFNLVMGKRTSVSVKGGMHYGYVNRIYNGMKFEW